MGTRGLSRLVLTSFVSALGLAEVESKLHFQKAEDYQGNSSLQTRCKGETGKAKEGKGRRWHNAVVIVS